jgi:hypothetical protein
MEAESQKGRFSHRSTGLPGLSMQLGYGLEICSPSHTRQLLYLGG